jgi:hypothetical protein
VFFVESHVPCSRSWSTRPERTISSFFALPARGMAPCSGPRTENVAFKTVFP